MELLHFENLSFTYPGTEKEALSDITLEIRQGDFVVICGESGCGKSTLLRMIKKELSPFGTRTGKICYRGCPLEELDARVSAQEIGFVMQNPDSQIVTDKVWHELAFGMECLGMPTPVIRRRVGEMASYFGIQDWFRKETDVLSGGQKQLLNLASIMVMQPKILILDEPTSQLDPIAASDFIATLQKLNRELDLTVLLVEHRLEEVFPIADRVLILEKGRVLMYDTPGNTGRRLRELDRNHPMLMGLPSAVRIYNSLSVKAPCPLTVKEGRCFLSTYFFDKAHVLQAPSYLHSPTVAVEMNEVWFRYERELPDILRGVSLQVYQGELFCLLGGNGAGKTTLLNVISGLNRAYRGKIRIGEKKIGEYKGNELYRQNLAFLPQNPQTIFLKNTVEEDLEEVLKAGNSVKADRMAQVREIADRLQIAPLLGKHPYDLSGGEQQKCALAKMLLLRPRILLMDEPTKGMDAYSKHTLRQILQQLRTDKITVIMVTHDVEFAAESASRCALFFDGEIISVDPPEKFFSENNFYTTSANRIARHLFPGAVTCEAVAALCEVEDDAQ